MGKIINNNLRRLFLTALYFLATFIIIEIPFLRYKAGYVTAFQTVLQVVLILFLIVRLKKINKISKMTLSVCIFLFVYLLSTVLNRGNLLGVFSEIVSILSMSLLIEDGVMKSKKEMVDGISMYFFVAVFINLLTIIVFPEGLYRTTNLQYQTSMNWFLGYKNVHVLFILPMITWWLIRNSRKSNTIGKSGIGVISISILSAVLGGSTTTIIGVIMFIIFMLLQHNKKSSNIIKYLIIYLSSFISIVFCGLQENFEELIYNLTNKHSDFVGRTYIWKSSIGLIADRPMIGYGKEDAIIRESKTRIWQAAHAHNGLLEIVYRTGLVGFGVFIYILWLALKKIKENYESRISIIIFSAIMAVFVMSIVEFYSFIFITPLLTMAYHVRELTANEA